jgi:hypothetical protein
VLNEVVESVLSEREWRDDRQAYVFMSTYEQINSLSLSYTYSILFRESLSIMWKGVSRRVGNEVASAFFLLLMYENIS